MLLPGDRGRDRGAHRRRASRASCRPGCPATPSRSAAAASLSDPDDLHRAGQRGAPGRERGRGRRRAAGPRVRGDGRLPPAALGDERGPGRAAALLRRDGRAARRLRRAVRDGARARPSRRSSRPTATSPAPRSGCSPTATRSATASSGCASSPGLDVGSTDGREKLSLGLKAMRVLGHRPPRRAGPRGGRRGRPRAAPDLVGRAHRNLRADTRQLLQSRPRDSALRRLNRISDRLRR